jgi:hypothetical protein
VDFFSVLTPPFANAMAMIAAASMTHDSGFHMNPRNLKNLLSCRHQHSSKKHGGLKSKTILSNNQEEQNLGEP